MGRPFQFRILLQGFERVVAEVLVERTIKCAEDHSLDNVVVVGGVAANKSLRKMMISEANKKSIKVHLAPLNLCTDNAAMIGAAALFRIKFKDHFSSCLLYTSPSPRDLRLSRMPSSA